MSKTQTNQTHSVPLSDIINIPNLQSKIIRQRQKKQHSIISTSIAKKYN